MVNKVNSSTSNKLYVMRRIAIVLSVARDEQSCLPFKQQIHLISFEFVLESFSTWRDETRVQIEIK